MNLNESKRRVRQIFQHSNEHGDKGICSRRLSQKSVNHLARSPSARHHVLATKRLRKARHSPLTTGKLRLSIKKQPVSSLTMARVRVTLAVHTSSTWISQTIFNLKGTKESHSLSPLRVGLLIFSRPLVSFSAQCSLVHFRARSPLARPHAPCMTGPPIPICWPVPPAPGPLQEQHGQTIADEKQ